MPKYLDGAGLSRFWNNIQDQIGSASQEQVDAWLAAHPEAITTVEDGTITTKKLADGAVTDAKLDGAGVKNVVATIAEGSFSDFTFVQSTFDGSSYVSSTTRIATEKVAVAANSVLTLSTVAATQMFSAYLIAEDGTVTNISWNYQQTYKRLLEFACTVVIVVAYRNGASISTSDSTYTIRIEPACGIAQRETSEKVDFLYDAMNKGQLADYGAWVQGGYDNGNAITSSARIRLDPFYVASGAIIDFNANGQWYYYYIYDKNGILTNAYGWLATDGQYTVIDDCYLGVMVRSSTGAAITPSDKLFTMDITLPYAANFDKAVTDIGAWEQGTITNVNGVLTPSSSSTRVRMIDNTAPVEAGQSIEIHVQNRRYYWHITDASNNILYSHGWESSDGEYVAPTSGYLKLLIGTINDTDSLKPEDVNAAVSIGFSTAQKLSEIADGGKYTYGGEKIAIGGRHGFDSKIAFTLPAVASGLNGVARYGTELFAFLTDGTINVYSEVDGSLIANFASNVASGSHGNTLCFADTLHDGNSNLPYLYIGTANNTITVVDISVAGTTYASTVVQVIDLSGLDSTVYGQYALTDFAIDFPNEVMYGLRYALNTYQASAGNYINVFSFPLPEVSSQSVAIQDSDIDDYFVLTAPLVYAAQQTVFDGGKIYFTAGGSTTGGNPYIHVIDIANKRFCTHVPLYGSIGYNEPEAIVIRDRDILVISNHTTNVYSLTFG